MKEIYITPNGIWECYGTIDLFFGWERDECEGIPMECIHG